MATPSSPANTRTETNRWSTAAMDGLNEIAMNDADDGALLRASYDGRVKLVDSLLKAGANVDDTNRRGTTALMAACEYGYTEVAKLLLNAGADIHRVDHNGWTALHAACLEEQLDATKLLLKHGADPEIVDHDGETAEDKLPWCSKIARLFATRRRFKLWRAATRTWRIATFWRKVAGRVDEAPVERGQKRARDE